MCDTSHKKSIFIEVIKRTKKAQKKKTCKVEAASSVEKRHKSSNKTTKNNTMIQMMSEFMTWVVTASFPKLIGDIKINRDTQKKRWDIKNTHQEKMRVQKIPKRMEKKLGHSNRRQM